MNTFRRLFSETHREMGAWFFPLLFFGIIGTAMYVYATIQEDRDLSSPERFQARCGAAKSTIENGNVVLDYVVPDYGTVRVTFLPNETVFSTREGGPIPLRQTALNLIGCRSVK